MPKIKREQTNDTYDEDSFSGHVSKKAKKVKVEDDAAHAAEDCMDDSARAHENGGMESLTYEEKLAFVNPISKPMASKKFTKKLFKLVKKASKHKGYVYCGLKLVQTMIRKGQTGVVLLAGDVYPIDILCHIPAVCEEKGLPYIWTPSRQDLGTALGKKRMVIACMVKEHDDYKELMEECAQVIEKENALV
ncbi:hypothetical protein MTO96_001468 [Rhipicephalus appendiculatus]|uniref:H/ACA ribonucleoprotein complex subunit 2 n=1 Tax=Rhipicephalus appendiculatus TaxID=34631 RepID=A0A131Z730_RHIAP